jgi:hypothetical protein
MDTSILEDPLTIDHPNVPAPPAGYDDPYEFVAAPSWFNLAVGEIGMFLLAIGVFTPLGIEVIGVEPVVVAFEDAFTLDNLAYGVMVAAVVGTIIAHEVVHALVARACGCTASVSVNLRRIEANTEISGAFLSRGEDALISIAPLVSLTVVGLVLLWTGPQWLALVALVVLIINAAGSGSDLTAALRLWRFPAGTLTYYVDGRLVLYEPAVE